MLFRVSRRSPGRGPRVRLSFRVMCPVLTSKPVVCRCQGMAAIATNRFGPGNPPTVVITADTIEVRNGASIAM